MVTFLNKLSQPRRSIVFDTYWRFAFERQSVFFNRIDKKPQPWTNDAIIQEHRFTNVYRVTDRVSQYLISEVIKKGDQSPKEVLFRILLFKIFNKVETWQLLTEALGELHSDDFHYSSYDQVLSIARKQGTSIYSGAYIMASPTTSFGHRYKHQNHLRLIQEIIDEKNSTEIIEAPSLQRLYERLLNLPSIGPFLAYQYAIDINYSSITDFSEMDFVKAGPGARDGIKKCFISIGDLTEEDVIRWMVDHQQQEFVRLGLDFQDLWGRPLQLIDCQNLFCEVDKYARLAHPEVSGVSNRIRIKQKFNSANPCHIQYSFPDKWHLKQK